MQMEGNYLVAQQDVVVFRLESNSQRASTWKRRALRFDRRISMGDSAAGVTPLLTRNVRREGTLILMNSSAEPMAVVAL